MVFEIDGHDLTPYIDFKGLKYSLTDLDSEETSRNLDGELMRNRVASKVRWDVPCRPLTTTEVSRIFSWIRPEFFTLRATDLAFGLRSGTFYSNNNATTVLKSSLTDDDEILWEGLTFPVIEK